MTQPPFDLAAAHRWFAVEFNNAAWDLVERPARTPDEDDAMLHAAHASVLHWQKVGTALHQQRGEHLLAHVYMQLNQSAAALAHATRCLQLSDGQLDAQTPFDRGTAFEAMARAYACAGQDAEARRYRERAVEAGRLIPEDDDRLAFDALLRGGNWFGLDPQCAQHD